MTTDQDSHGGTVPRTGAARVAEDTLGHAADDAGVLLRALRDYLGLVVAVPMDGVVQRLVAAGWDALDVADASEGRAVTAEAGQEARADDLLRLTDAAAAAEAPYGARSAAIDARYFRVMCVEMQRELREALSERKYGPAMIRCLRAASERGGRSAQDSDPKP